MNHISALKVGCGKFFHGKMSFVFFLMKSGVLAEKPL